MTRGPSPAAAFMLRDAVAEDLPRIVAIYNAAIPGRLATADTEPVTLESRRSWFHERDLTRHPIWVAERGGEVVGWLAFGRFYGRPAYAGTSELAVYVDPAAVRSGVASALLERAVARAPELGLTTLLGFIFAHNAPSLALFHRFGFQQWGHLPRVAVLDGVERDLLILGRRTDGRAP